MNKTWRASDVLILVILAIMGVFVGLQMLEATRLHERMNDSVTISEELRSRQNDVAERLKAVENALTTLKTAPVVVTPEAPSVTPPVGGVTPPPVPTETIDPAEATKRGDTMVIHCSARIRTLNPLTYKDANAGDVLDLLYDTMITRDLDTMQWKPRMAESWETSDDKLTYIFTLREGLRWSDGQPITAEDVLFSYQTMMNPAVDAARMAGYYKDVESVTALDARRVQFKFKQPYFLSLSMAGGIIIIPKHVYAFTGEAGGIEFSGKRQPTVFSGPFVLDKWDESVEIVLRRNNRYWGKPAHFDRIVFRIVEENSSAIQMLKAGKLDFMELRAEDYVQLQKVPEVVAKYNLLQYPSPGMGYTYFAWNNATDLFKDARVRLAMTYLVPRERMLHEILFDLGQITTGPFWPGAPGTKIPLQYDPTVKPHPYDPARAVMLLNQAGWRDTDNDGILDKNGQPLKFKLMVPAASKGFIDMANWTRESMAKVGVGIEVETVEWTVFTKKLDDRTFDACGLAWTGGVEDDPNQIWHSSSIANNGSNFIAFNHPEADRLIEEARRELDETKRNEIFHRFHQLLHREQPYTFLFSRPALVAVDKRFDGVKVHLLGLDLREWWTPVEKRRSGN